MIKGLPESAKVAIERLSVKDMRFKSRQMNRALRSSQLGYVRDKLKFKLDERNIRYRSVQPLFQPTMFDMWLYIENEPPQSKRISLPFLRI